MRNTRDREIIYVNSILEIFKTSKKLKKKKTRDNTRHLKITMFSLTKIRMRLRFNPNKIFKNQRRNLSNSLFAIRVLTIRNLCPVWFNLNHLTLQFLDIIPAQYLNISIKACIVCYLLLPISKVLLQLST